MAEAQDGMRAESGAGRRSPDEIRNEIERTRSEMHETVDALERRLSPGELFDEVWHRLRGSGGGGAGSVVRDHPVPLALMGLGLGWLAVEKATDRGGDGAIRTREGMPVTGYSTDLGYYEADTLPRSTAEDETDEGTIDKIRHKASAVKDKASEVKDKASHLGGSAMHARERVGDAASSAGHRVTETASHTAERARGTARRAQERLGRMNQEQPLALGAITFGIGLAAGLATPTTHWEDEHVGPVSDRVKESAKETAHDAREVAKDVAHEAGEVAREARAGIAESARETEGRSAGERIGDAVDRAKEVARESAERHHIDREGLRDRGEDVKETAKQHMREAREDVSRSTTRDQTRL